MGAEWQSTLRGQGLELVVPRALFPQQQPLVVGDDLVIEDVLEHLAVDACCDGSAVFRAKP